MPKFRSREIVTAVQWFPGGKKLTGVQELADGSGAFFLSCIGGLADWVRLAPGDYVVFGGRENVFGGQGYVCRQKDFEKNWEDIGG